MAAHGIADFDELVDRSIADPAWFWDAVVGYLGLPVRAALRPGDRHVGRHPLGDLVHRGHHERRGRVRRPVGGRARPTPLAIVWEGEDGEVRELTYAAAARRRSTGSPRCSSATAWATATRSASSCRWSPRSWWPRWRWPSSAPSSCRSSRATAPTRSRVRLVDAGAKALVTADGFLRRGTRIDMLGDARAAAAEVDGLETIVVVPRLARLADVGTTELVDDAEPYRVLLYPDHPHDGEQPTAHGRQRAPAVHRLHVGHDRAAEGVGPRPRRLRREDRRGGRLPDRRPAGDRLFWFTDFGWIMGPWEIVGGARERRHGLPLRRRAGLARARPAVGLPRAPPRDRARHLAHARSAP